MALKICWVIDITLHASQLHASWLASEVVSCNSSACVDKHESFSVSTICSEQRWITLVTLSLQLPEVVVSLQRLLFGHVHPKLMLALLTVCHPAHEHFTVHHLISAHGNRRWSHQDTESSVHFFLFSESECGAEIGGKFPIFLSWRNNQAHFLSPLFLSPHPCHTIPEEQYYR